MSAVAQQGDARGWVQAPTSPLPVGYIPQTFRRAGSQPRGLRSPATGTVSADGAFFLA